MKIYYHEFDSLLTGLDWQFIYWTILRLATTLHRTLLHTDWYLQSRCSVTSSNGGRSSASGLKSSQGGEHFTPVSYSDCWFQLVFPTATSSGLKWTCLKIKVIYDQPSIGQSALVSSIHLRLRTRFVLLLDSCGCVDVGRPLWGQDGSVVYNCCWSSSVQSF
jgi:hypothetical protein